MVEVYLLPALQGDFIWIHYGEEGDWHNIIIDGGTARMQGEVRNTLEHIMIDRDEQIDAIFLSHIDSDHIGGLVTEMPLVDEDVLKEKLKAVYMNTGRGIRKKLGIAAAQLEEENVEDSIETEDESNNYSVAEAISWMKFLEKSGFTEKEEGDTTEEGLHEYTLMGDTLEIGGAKLEIISPGEKELRNLVEKKWEPYKVNAQESGNYDNDTEKVLPEFCAQNLEELQKEKLKYESSVNNKSSIAFLFRYGDDVAIAFLGDAAAGICVDGLTACGYGKKPRVKVDAVKIAHHGSNHNMSDRLLAAFDTNLYMVSTNGENPNGGLDVPHKTTVAHLLKAHKDSDVTLLCNYNWKEDSYRDEYFTEQDKRDYLDNGKLNVHCLTDDEYSVKEGLVIYGYRN